jgi:hypothetical protein
VRLPAWVRACSDPPARPRPPRSGRVQRTSVEVAAGSAGAAVRSESSPLRKRRTGCWTYSKETRRRWARLKGESRSRARVLARRQHLMLIDSEPSCDRPRCMRVEKSWLSVGSRGRASRDVHGWVLWLIDWAPSSIRLHSSTEQGRLIWPGPAPLMIAGGRPTWPVMSGHDPKETRARRLELAVGSGHSTRC